jgi:hypothetical protein
MPVVSIKSDFNALFTDTNFMHCGIVTQVRNCDSAELMHDGIMTLRTYPHGIGTRGVTTCGIKTRNLSRGTDSLLTAYNDNDRYQHAEPLKPDNERHCRSKQRNKSFFTYSSHKKGILKDQGTKKEGLKVSKMTMLNIWRWSKNQAYYYRILQRAFRLVTVDCTEEAICSNSPV